jgi:hypothetical protein
MLVMDDNKRRGHINGSFDHRERHRSVFEVIPGRRDNPNNVIASHHSVAGFGEHRFGTVEVESNKSTWGVTNVVDFGDRLLSRITPLGQVNGGAKPVKLVGQ